MWGWFLYSFNPSVPLLTADLGITRAQGGLHGTALAVGSVVAALMTPWLVRTYGRRATLMAGGFVVAAGIVGVLLGTSLAWTLPAMFVVSVGANIAVSSAQVALALHHRGVASAVITEANGVGSSLGLLGPLAVGGAVAVGWGWRPAVAVTAVLAVVTAFLALRVKLPSRETRVETVASASEAGRGDSTGPTTAPTPAPAAPAPSTSARRWPGRSARLRPRALASWCFLGAILAGIGLENVTTYWSADLVIGQTGAPAGIATATTAGLVAGMSLIRFVVGPLSLRVRPAHLLTASFLVAIVGWAVLWTATVPAVALAGLFVAGLGYGAQYPLSISLLLRAAGAAVDKAQARATLAGGLAIGVLPFALGALADAVGPHRAFLLVPVIAVFGALAALAGARASRGDEGV
ncbi:MAG: MFS transporter [Actinomycetales bacterium]|nr:MFS transporter [Actinomycetales bacterium]